MHTEQADNKANKSAQKQAAMELPVNPGFSPHTLRCIWLPINLLVSINNQMQLAHRHHTPCKLAPGVGFAPSEKIRSASFNKCLMAERSVRGFPAMCGLLWLNRLISNRGPHIYSAV